jgi:hypothetical protein
MRHSSAPKRHGTKLCPELATSELPWRLSLVRTETDEASLGQLLSSAGATATKATAAAKLSANRMRSAATALIVLDRLLQFCLRVHHKWSVVHDRLTERLAQKQ